MRELSCPEHPGGQVRRPRTHGPRGRAVYPECVPADGTPRHLLSWEEATSDGPVQTEVRLAPELPETILTPSELVVLCEAANGHTAAETARRLGKGTQTVKTQRCRILMKLHASNSAQAVCIATERGILVVDRDPAPATPPPRDVQRRLQPVRG